MKRHRLSAGAKCRMLLLFSLLSFSFFPPGSYGAAAQNITLSLRNASMKEIMQEIKRVGQYDFIVNDSDISGIPRRTVTFTDATIDRILSECLANSGLSYTIDEGTIMIITRIRRSQ